MRKKVKNLTIGDITEGDLITKLDLEDNDKIWDGKPNCAHIELIDPHYGQLCKELKNLDEYVQIETNPKKIIKMCRDALGMIYHHISLLESDAAILHMKIREMKGVK